MVDYQPTIRSVTVVILFAVCYSVFLARKVSRGDLDIYDLFMLSMVGFLSAVFVMLPDLANGIASMAGVAFPFVVMFGFLFVVLFLLVHRLTVRIHRLETTNRSLIQEISLLKGEFDQVARHES